MYNWNSVFMRYCDGGSFSGNNQTVTNYQGHNLYFRGFRILQAMFQDLYSNRRLNKATDVVVSGCSAGGLATYLHVDWWHSRLPHSAKVVGMPDSGFFLDYESQAKHYHSSMIWVFNQMNATSGVNQACIQSHQKTSDTWKCFFAEHTAPFISTPIVFFSFFFLPFFLFNPTFFLFFLSSFLFNLLLIHGKLQMT